jgi:hypothetical protein
VHPSGYHTEKGDHHDLPKRFDLTIRIATQGFDILPELIRIVINTAMQGERQ